MAGSHTTSERAALHVIAARSVAALPRIQIPEDCPIERGSLRFTITTDLGAIEVEGYGSYFLCQGTAPALESVGLLRPEWLPGIPGNCRTRQTVVFDGSAPRLVPRASRKTNTLPHIVIGRVKKDIFYVTVPADEKQRATMEQLWNHHLAERRARESIEATTKVSEYLRSADFSQSDFRSQCLGYCDATDYLLNTICEESRFTYDEASMEKIIRLTRELRSAVNLGSVVAKPSTRSEGNVIHLSF